MTDYFKRLTELLEKERQADEASFNQLTKGAGAAQRREAGLAWYPIAIRNTEPTRGDYLSVEVERTTHKDLSHQIRFGSSVALFSNHDVNDRVNATVTYIGGDRMRITLRTEELPDWADQGKLGIDLLFDAYSYDEMRDALKEADRSDSRLIQVLTGNASTNNTPVVYHDDKLNASQQAAVQSILGAQDLAIVHGPPGTGKTTTLVSAIKALITQGEKQILVVAPSNTAVDLLSEKLAEIGLDVLRIGNAVRVSERLQQLTLDSRMATHAQMKDAKKLRKQAAEFKNMAHKYKRSFGKAEREQRKALFDEAHRIMRDVTKIEEFVSDDVIDRAQVITATLVGADHHSIKNRKYNTVIMDEAGQALEPAAWIPILKATRLVLAGDHLQLPPTVKSQQSGLKTTLLEKAVALHPQVVTMLDEQYRMNEQIMGFPSLKFYEDRLAASPSVSNRLLRADDKPITFVDTAGAGYEEQLAGNSVTNPEEAAFLVKHIDQTNYSSTTSVAIIAPYKEQVNLLKELTKEMTVEVNTVDGFQGQERDVVYISLTRSNGSGTIGFLSDYRRMNVAMTRARMKLVLIGDSATLSQTPFYADMINYIEQLGGYESVWEY
ncbi:AAA domain-containing protein [Mucilaginibacter myungsuensis]|uniref:AAA family ATPase n=1 Tax=Mucilaginibacter myungsuensis TaxID=649104 RepID=A0A929KXW1_9SPHI|nr:AAA domain-containing protein [Mucilaginibacter myungsuensis]MBE9660630.1 AAA family ATPase [Mucilaginibacter myungsuensis]MDN3600675.1 AAA domain-containing protein [Mucilaginibacter myungsuensis]